jgi:GR25 family glycosyltransferase involved in LPS biosynthesis
MIQIKMNEQILNIMTILLPITTIIIIYLYYKINKKLKRINKTNDYNYVCTDKEIKMNMYYINIKKSVNRNKSMIKQFSKYCTDKFTLNRIEAITPFELSRYNENKLIDTCGNTELELACLLSHIKAIHTCYHNGDNYSLIMEDDVIIHRMPKLSKLIDSAPDYWDVLQLFSLDCNIYLKNKQRDKNKLWVKYTYSSFSAAVYLINRKGMEKILRNFFENNTGIEISNWDYIYKINFNTLSYLGKKNCVSEFHVFSFVNTYVSTDLFFSPQANESTIHEDHLAYQQKQTKTTLDYFLKNGYKFLDLEL